MSAKLVSATFLAVILCVCQSSAVQAQYRPMPLFGGGYKSKQVAPDRWKVRGFSPTIKLGKAIDIAIYRAAILAKRAGYSHFQVVDSYLQTSYGASANQNAEFTVVGTRTPDVPIPCEAKKRWIENCRLLNVDEVLEHSGRALGRNPETDLAAGN